MGSGNTRVRVDDESSNRIDKLIIPTTVVVDTTLIGQKWEKRDVSITRGHIIISKINDDTITSIKLDDEFELSSYEKSDTNNMFDINLRQGENNIYLRFVDEVMCQNWIKYVQKQKEMAATKLSVGLYFGLNRIANLVENEEDANNPRSVKAPITDNNIESLHENMLSSIKPPIMKILIIVVGTRGDVQPFVYLALELKRQGHTVRVATHAEYRNDVTKHDLLFYPLAGDPRKLSEYMVKTAGRLIPDLLNEEERAQLPEKMQMIKDICYSTWPACIAPDPEDKNNIPFVAEAIISNPVSYGHIHCAEALAVPLHIMFPQPWYPTKCFPHPLSNLSYSNQWSIKNSYSYYLVDEFMWLGTRSFINTFRTEVLKINPIRTGEAGESLLVNHNVPISHMWSPSFVPRCIDWPSHVDVVGEFTDKHSASASSYVPDEKLSAFLKECSDDKPIYIGFGSMVIADGEKLVNIIKAAAEETSYPVLLQSGWTKYGENFEMISDKVMVIGPMPHDWLFSQVSAVIHHGGAGTTSAGLRSGNPTFICPFFGDQHFWAEMVNRSGAGPAGCPIESLTTEILVNAFKMLKSSKTKERVEELGLAMRNEDGVMAGVNSFYKNLPLENMLCEVSLFHKKSLIANVYCRDCDLKISNLVDCVIHHPDSNRSHHTRIPYQGVKWGAGPPSSLLYGIKQGLGILAYEFAGGIYDLVHKPVQGAIDNGVRGAATGVASGVYGLVARPVKGGGILIDRLMDKDDYVHSSISKQNSSKTSESITNNDINATHPTRNLTQEEVNIEECLEKALKFRDMWMKLDTTGDRKLNLKELEVFLPYDEAAALLKIADINDDGELTFAELALKVMQFQSMSDFNKSI